MNRPLEKSFKKIKTLDMHTGGEPVRIIEEGFPEFENMSILEIRNELKQNHDHLRKMIMWEPRGHADMYGLLKVPAQRKDSSFGVIFMHNEGYSTMCGHATIAIGRAAYDLGWLSKYEDKPTLKIDAPCGQLKISITQKNEEVENVSFENVPSFYVGTYKLEIPDLGTIQYDLAYGGAFYAYLDVHQIGIKCSPEYYSELIHRGKQIKSIVTASNNNIIHPFEEDLSFLYGVIFIDNNISKGVHSRNVCVFADGEVDRCATGSGVSGRAAIHYAKNELALNKCIKIESIIGSSLVVEVINTCNYEQYDAIIPKVSGMAYYTGRNEFWIDPRDPLKEGFILR